jgi:hypothetical protein
METKHIRRKGYDRDKRVYRTLKAVPRKSDGATLCGAEAGVDDLGRENGEATVRHSRIPRLAHWRDGICQDCIDEMESLIDDIDRKATAKPLTLVDGTSIARITSRTTSGR